MVGVDSYYIGETTAGWVIQGTLLGGKVGELVEIQAMSLSANLNSVSVTCRNQVNRLGF
jgi:hypothetical protein